MAKKFKQSRRINTNLIVQYLYNNGVFQSCIAHAILIIVLALITNHLSVRHSTPILLSFSDKKEIIEDFYQLESIEIPLPVEKAVDTDSELNNLENMVSDIVKENSDKVLLPDILDYDQGLLDKSRDHQNDINISSSDMLTVLKTNSSSKTKKPTNIRDKPVRSMFAVENVVGEPIGNSQQSSGLIELDQRLGQYGAKGGDVQVSLSWNTIDDIDLHVKFMPLQSHISWMRKFGVCGGVLDIDMNVSPDRVSNRPIENVFWAINRAPRGTYVVGVHNYMPWSRNQTTQVLVVVKIKGKVYSSKTVNVTYGQGIQEVIKFNF